MIAALFVERAGSYWDLPHVDPWDKERDARLYDGPWPIVAHPPCERWGRYWFGGPTWIAAGKPRKKLGDDAGCFSAALAAVRRWGGVIEHPEGSHAWRHFRIPHPDRAGGWLITSEGWTCCVEQGWYGHRARKATWLLFAGLRRPPELKWGRAPGDFVRLEDGFHTADERRKATKRGVIERLSHRERAATPLPFRDLLLSLASLSAGKTQEAA